MADELRLALEQIEKLKSVDRETLLEAIRGAIETAARKSITRSSNITVEVDPHTLAFHVFEIRTVTDHVKDTTSEISLEDALQLNDEVVIGNRLKLPAEPKDFGRIAAQTARQVIIQKLKDAERDRVYGEFKEREGDLVTGTVKRLQGDSLIVGIGQVDAIIMRSEQSPREKYKLHDRIRAQVIKVEKSQRGTSVKLSRTSPDLVRSLFEMEVPEIYEGTVIIKGIAREAGSRTKVAVLSKDSNVDPVGACVGLRGSRVRAVVEELAGEKIDIVRWTEDPVQFCINALNPADILRIHLNPDTKSIQVIVPQDQLSLAIGKRGQNARLASKLMGWSIDIRGDKDNETSDQSAGSTQTETEVEEDTDGSVTESTEAQS